MDLFEEIVNESSLISEIRQEREGDIIKAINNVLRVRINYNDEDENNVWNYEKTRLVGPEKGKNERYILPVAFGLTKSGKKAIRAYQSAGSTRRGEPHWKLFLLDRIFQWSNGKRSFKEYKDALINLGLNTTGDKGMTTLFAVTPIANSNVQVAKNTSQIGTQPLSKNDVSPSSQSQSPDFKSDNFTKTNSKESSTIDIPNNNSYFKNKVEAPETEPVTKVKVSPQPKRHDLRGLNGRFVKSPYNFASDKRQFDINSPEWKQEYDKAAQISQNGPVTKSEVDGSKNNPLTKSFNDMNSRMDGLYNDKEEKEK